MSFVDNIQVELPDDGETAWGDEVRDSIRRLAGATVFPAAAFGAVGDGSADDTAPIIAARDAAAAAGNGLVHLDARKTYKVSLGSITGWNGGGFIGGGKLTTTATTDGAFISCTSITDFYVGGLRVQSPNNKAVLVRCLNACYDIRLGFNQLTEARLIDTNNLALAYSDVTLGSGGAGGNVSRRIKTFFNEGVCTTATAEGGGSDKPFIFLWYVVGGRHIGNESRGHASCIQWWGGNALPDPNGGNGNIANARKCGGFQILGCSAFDCTVGGIWGSMGKDIVVSTSHAEDVDDLGFDCEGGQNVLFKGITGRNCASGIVGAFFFNRNVRFEGVEGETDATDGIVAQVKNVAQTHENVDVTIQGSFTANSGIGLFRCEAVGNLTLDLVLTNVRLDLLQNNQGDVTAKIKQKMYRAASAAISGVLAGYNHGCLLEIDLTSVSAVAQPAGSFALNVVQITNAINDLRVALRGWGTTPVRVEFASIGGTAATTRLRGNLGEGTGFTRVESELVKSFLWTELENNSGVPFVPSAIPVAGYWDVGQKIFFGTPTAGGKIGAVCVVAGTPGTWKQFGAIDA